MTVLIVAVNLEMFVFEQYTALKKAGVDIITYRDQMNLENKFNNGISF